MRPDYVGDPFATKSISPDQQAAIGSVQYKDSALDVSDATLDAVQDAVKAARQVIGATDPLEAAPGSIRGVNCQEISGCCRPRLIFVSLALSISPDSVDRAGTSADPNPVTAFLQLAQMQATTDRRALLALRFRAGKAIRT